MKKHGTFVLQIALYAFCAIAILLVGVSPFHYQKAKRTLMNKVPILLEETIRVNIAKKTQNVFYCVNYVHDPAGQKMGEYEEKVATYADTTFTFKMRITDPATQMFNTLQTALVDSYELNANDLHHIFDSLLHANHIHAQSIIGITTSFYIKMNDWSNDTTSLNINYRTTCANQGLFEDINYYAYLDYSPLTLCKLMPKWLIPGLFISLIFIGLLLYRKIDQERKIKNSGITALADGNYQIADILFDVQEKKLIAKAHETKLTPQLHELFLMFVQADRQRVNKEEIKQRFWPKNSDPINNMTSAIGRIKVALKEVDSIYTIVSDPKNDDFYLFLPHFSS